MNLTHILTLTKHSNFSKTRLLIYPFQWFIFALETLCFKTQLLFVIKFLWMSGFDGLLFYTSLLQLDSKYNSIKLN